jgi:PAS domain S-box-containing protein
MVKANPNAQWEKLSRRSNQGEKYLRWFVDFCPAAIAMFDSDLNYILVSQPWVKMLAIPRLKLIGTNIYTTLSIPPIQRNELDRCLLGGQMYYSTELEITERGGLTNNFQLLIQPWYNDDGSTGGIIIASSILEDCPSTDLKYLLQEEIAERQYFEDAFTKIGTALESTNDAICITDRTGEPIYINSAFSDLFSHNLNTLQNSNHLGSLFAEPQLAQAIHTAVVYGGTWTGELEMRDRNQQPIPISLKVNPVKSSAGEVIGITYVCTNIRDRKAAEAEINKSFAALGAALEATADGILVLDAVNNIIICNQKFVDLWRIPKSIFTNYDDSSILKYITERIKSSQHLKNFGEGLSSEQNSFEVVELDDGRTLECYSQPQNILNNCAGRVWRLRDITERLASEALVRASEEKYRLQAKILESAFQELKSTQSQLIQAKKMSGLGQLIAGIAHEINNPVNFIYGNLSYADRYTKDLLSLIEIYRSHYPNPIEAVQLKLEEIDIDFLVDDFMRLINSIRVDAERIQKIVQSLNKFSRSDEVGCKYVNIHEGIDETLMILQSRLKTNPHRPEIRVDKLYGDLPEIECYAGQLNQVFMNLLTNAIDALEEDAKTNGNWQVINDKPQWVRNDKKISRILIKTEIQDSDLLVISISDNGNGIPKALHNRLFDLFFTTKPVGKGTGLGLSIAYQIITENHGGKLSFDSTVGKGTEFVIEIPVKQS